MNVSKDRQEVAKRKQSQLASNSLAGILPVPIQAQHSPQDVLIAGGRPGSPQQQASAAGAHSPSRLAAQVNARPASAGAAYGTLGSSTAAIDKVWPLSTHNSHAAGGGDNSSSSVSTSRSPSSLSPDRSNAAGQALGGKARPGSLTAAAPEPSSPDGLKTAYQAYEDRPVGAANTQKTAKGRKKLEDRYDRHGVCLLGIDVMEL